MPNERPILSYLSPLDAPEPALAGEFVVTFAPAPLWPAMVREALILALLLYGLALTIAAILDGGLHLMSLTAAALICFFATGRIRQLIRSVRFSVAPIVLRISAGRLRIQAPSRWSAGTLSEPLNHVLACEVRRDPLMFGRRYLLQIDTVVGTIKIPIALESPEFIQEKAMDLRNAIDRFKMER
jgi:hypothetical protein